jgi:hypothetical protein
MVVRRVAKWNIRVAELPTLITIDHRLRRRAASSHASLGTRPCASRPPARCRGDDVHAAWTMPAPAPVPPWARARRHRAFVGPRGDVARYGLGDDKRPTGIRSFAGPVIAPGDVGRWTAELAKAFCGEDGFRDPSVGCESRTYPGRGTAPAGRPSSPRRARIDLRQNADIE